jgi:hypothetical protein
MEDRSDQASRPLNAVKAVLIDMPHEYCLTSIRQM